MNIWPFLIKNYWPQVASAAAVFGGLFYACSKNSDLYNDVNWLDAIAGIGTLLFAIYLWWNSIWEAWKNSLPKRLDAYFSYDGRDVLVFKNILIFGESDIRAWSQQIARQKAAGDIQFEPFFRFLDKDVERDKNNKSYRSYQITFFLSAIPEKLKSKLGYDVDGASPKKCMVWQQKENEDGTISMDEVLIQSNVKM